jgi:hypothetical protein
VAHNTLYRNAHAQSGKANLVIGSDSTNSDVFVKNNIVSESAASLDLQIRQTTFTSDYNDVFNTRALAVYWLSSNVTWPSYLSSSGQDAHSITADPAFVDGPAGNFQLTAGSPCVNGGDFLARTTSAGSGTSIVVDNAQYFTDGMGLVTGDEIVVGSNSVAKITAINRGTKTLTVDRSLTWNAGDAVGYPYTGSKPDIGAFER